MKQFKKNTHIEIGVNNFIWDTKKYPNSTQMIEEFHKLGVRVMLWVTSVVDTDSSNYDEGYKAGYYLNYGLTLKW